MGVIPVGQAVLQRVVATLGFDDAADRLRIRRQIMKRLLDGEVPVPDDVLLKAVDVLTDEPPGP